MKNHKKRGKKAELSTQQIVLLIILIASFIIILFFLFRLNPGEEKDMEACHQSVVMRGNTAIPSDAIPLKCQTKYLCISKDGTCEGLTKPVLEKVKTKEEVYDVLANEMANCWWMFGEGKLNYVGKDMKQNFYCSICTQFMLDNSLNEIEGIMGSINAKDFYEYLENKEYDSETNYLEYLTGSKNVRDLERSMTGQNMEFGSYSLGRQHYVLMGIYSEVGVWKWVGIGAAALGVIAIPFTGGVSSVLITAAIIGSATVGGGVGGYFVGTAVKGESGNDYLSPTIIEANSREFDAFDCKNVMTTS